MFHRIVVPLDGTAFAEEALLPARALAEAFGAQVLLVRAQQLPVMAGLHASFAADAALDDLDVADAYLHEVVTRLRADGVDADLLLYVAAPDIGIARAAVLDHADLIVMTSHLRWKLPAHSDGSTTLAVLARSGLPILAWRAGDSDLPAVDAPIVVPLDGTPLAEAALPVAEALARALKSYLVLVRAAHQGQEEDAGGYLRAVAMGVEARGVRAVSVTRAGAALSVIDTTWREQSAALLVLATHGRRPGAQGYLGSVAASLIEEIEVPMLVLHPVAEGQPSGAASA